MGVSKLFKWGASMVRVIGCRLSNRGRLKVARGKPLYLGKGARIHVEKNGVCRLGYGTYISRGCLLQVNGEGRLDVGDNVFFNENCHVVVQEKIHIGEATLFGPNVCIYDHDHIFDDCGVHSDLESLPVWLGARCWIAANAVVTKGVRVVDGVLVGAGSVVTRPLDIAGVYAGAPAKPIHLLDS